MSELNTEFILWYTELKQLAKDNEAEWMISADPENHRAAYQSGLSPFDEYTEIARMAEWRGCGCGGGG